MRDTTSPVDYSKTDCLTFNRDYQDILKCAGANSFDLIWRYHGGETIKNIRARAVIRIEIQYRGEKRRFYLKRHNQECVVFRRLLAFFYPKLALSQGLREFGNICDFRKYNLPTVAPVAAGENFPRFFHVRSFLITEDFSPFISLEDLLRDRPQFLTGKDGVARKKILLKKVALLARRMHQEGFNHRDFNATHILLHYGNGSDIPKIALFDLQRVDRRRFLKFRWMIKSLSELNYTLPDGLFEAEDRIYLFQAYKGKNRLRCWDRLQWFWITRKTVRIRKHTEKMMRRRREEKKRRGLPER
jgi:Lipopolysaccharide kinase (Kdo/WaaP) family.